MEIKIKQIQNNALKEIKEVKGADFLENIWRKYLGRQDGRLTKVLRGIKNLPVDQRPKVGYLANRARNKIEKELERKKHQLAIHRPQSTVNNALDITLPGKKIEFGHLHPHTQMRKQVAEIFYSMGFDVLEGRELETDYYNFETLNIPAGHPARDMWDTFYLKSKVQNQKSKLLLRTHTSAMQVRVMEKQKPPLKVCVIGKCFRHEATDTSHEHTLYQIEGFVVDKEITIAHLIYTLKEFLSVLFGTQVKTRFRPSYFPFTEPSFEVDFACLNCQEKGCSVCCQTGWVEILGCGMVHPKVFESAGYPRGAYTGFAFGVGLDRLVMMKHKIDDIRWFHSGDLRFLRQF
ncbi:phenylalanine--tRNA ligase subunit alpha [Patescibacteria group bacterium]|nr:phenylalanine--tRNA ligase subunit alpha [Patescibacteria group bacterium]